MTIIPVILAGGLGTRLWPLSRSVLPKQLLPLMTPRTLFQETLLRAKQIAPLSPPLVLCNQAHRFLIAEQLKEIGVHDAIIIIEPIGKNTAAAATIAALYSQKNFTNDSVLFVLPSDHWIQSSSHFVESSMIGYKNALENKLVTFGISPCEAETGYGYIRTAKEKNEYHAHAVLEFIEKPNQAKADSYLKSGDYFWNSGMFMFKSSCFLHELNQHAPDIVTACQKSIRDIKRDLDFMRLDEGEFERCPSTSIDYAVMEKTKNAVVVPFYSQWSDVGSWSALWKTSDRDKNDNVIKGDVLAHDVTSSYLHAENRLLAVMGVKDLIIVETKDTVLVAHKSQSQKVKEIVERLKNEYRLEIDAHPKVYRPWGSYELIDQGNKYQVKRITVKPGASLSLQSHQHRSEHWVVVKGVAEVTCGEKIFLLKENESTYIPNGVKHRLSNASKEDLEIIEVQSGNYLGEDDIVRYEDVYGRD